MQILHAMFLKVLKSLGIKKDTLNRDQLMVISFDTYAIIIKPNW